MINDDGSAKAMFDQVPEFYFHTIRVLYAQTETMLHALQKAKAHPKGDALLGAKLAGSDTTLHQRLEQFNQRIRDGHDYICEVAPSDEPAINPTLEDHCWNLRDWQHALNRIDPDRRYSNFVDPLSKIEVDINGTVQSIWLMEYFDLWLLPNLYLHMMGGLLILAAESVELDQSSLLRCYTTASPDEAAVT